MKLISSESYCQILQTFSRKIVLDNTSFSQMWIYSKPFLVVISANSTFRTLFDFKKLKIICCWDIYHFCYDYKLLPFSNKPYQPEMNFIENKHLLGLLVSCSGLLHVTVWQSNSLKKSSKEVLIFFRYWLDRHF